jgi:hypothetical protein
MRFICVSRALYGREWRDGRRGTFDAGWQHKQFDQQIQIS